MTGDYQDLSGLLVVVNGEPVPLVIIGGMKEEDGKEYVIITNVPALDIADYECEVFELLREDGEFSIQSIKDDRKYVELIRSWEDKISDS